MITRSLSQKFRFFSFVSIALLLFVHGYNLKETYLAPFSLVKEELTLTTFIEYLFANGLLRFRIPLLFIISGYIFAMQDFRPYPERVKKRVMGLLVPYFIWSAVGLAITYLLQQYTITAKAVYDSQLDQLGDNRPYVQIGWAGIVQRWLLVPVSFQLWFIRSLFVYNICYPVIKYVLLKYPAIWFCLLLIAWLFFIDFLFIEAQGLLFFSAGVWLYKKGINLEKQPPWLSSYLCWLFFAGTAVIKTFMAFEFEDNTPMSIHLFSLLQIITVTAGIGAVWFSTDKIVKWAMSKHWFVWLTPFSFIIFAMHVPMLPYLTRLIYLYCSNVPAYRLLTYIFAPLIVLCLCILTGALLRKVLPRTYRLATGGRGF